MDDQPEDNNLPSRRAPQRRLCYWRDPANHPPPSFPSALDAVTLWSPEDSEARYRYERSQAELLFRVGFTDWETQSVKHPPRLVVNGIRTEIVDVIAIADSLGRLLTAYLTHVLLALGDLLIDRNTPGSEAIQAFDHYAQQLLDESYQAKWLFGFRRLDLTEDTFRDCSTSRGLSEQANAGFGYFLTVKQDLIQQVRHDFEDLLWKAEEERLQDEPPPLAEIPVVAATSKKTSPTAIGRNIDRLRKECGWSFNELAIRTGVDKTLILAHVNKGAVPRPNTQKIYADAFSRELKRPVTIAEIES